MRAIWQIVHVDVNKTKYQYMQSCCTPSVLAGFFFLSEVYLLWQIWYKMYVY
jgi:hypothetical protein